MKIVSIKYQDNFRDSEIHYYSCEIDDVKEGDRVVIESKSGFCVVHVVEIMPNIAYTPIAYIIDKVDTKAFEERKAKIERKAKLKEKMAHMKSKIDEMEMMEFYATKNPEMAALLKEFKSLDKEG
jgi:formylmethanofuran dehydrogenase subunit D